MPEQLSKNNDVSKFMDNFFKKKKFQKNFSRQISESVIFKAIQFKVVKQ